MSEPVLFAFPGVKVLQPDEEPDAASPGFLLLTIEHVPTEWDPSKTDLFLHLKFTPDSPAAQPINLRIEASNSLTKLNPYTFQLSTSFGQLAIVFPPLAATIPLEDQRIDIPVEVRRGMTWEPIVREFENEIDRFVVYRKNEFSLAEGGGLAAGTDTKGGYPDEKAGHGFGEFSESGTSRDMTNIKPYDPRDYHGSPSEEGRLVLVDEDNGSEVGEVGGTKVHAEGVHAGSKDPVEITVAEDGQVNVHEAAYLKDAEDPRYKDSTIVGTAATVSRLIVTTSNYLGKALHSGADSFTQKTKPAEKPITFQPITHSRAAKFHNFTEGAVKVSSQTLGRATYFAQTAGAKLAGHKPRDPNVNTDRGRPSKPGVLNKSMIAFGVVTDGLEHAGKTLLGHGQEAATKVVSHKYGPEAGQIARQATGSIKNVGLVYIDAAGVSRRAVIKGVAKGVVIGHMKNGGDVIVPAGDQPALGERGDKLGSPGRAGPAGTASLPPGPPPSYGSAVQQADGQMYFPPPPEKGRAPSGEYRY